MEKPLGTRRRLSDLSHQDDDRHWSENLRRWKKRAATLRPKQAERTTVLLELWRLLQKFKLEIDPGDTLQDLAPQLLFEEATEKIAQLLALTQPRETRLRENLSSVKACSYLAEIAIRSTEMLHALVETSQRTVKRVARW
jgi:hypothetical protein